MSSWFDDLEARLNQQLEAFLQANPAQQTKLEQQDARDRQERLGQSRMQLQQQAVEQRQALLALASEIRQWQDRCAKARAAGASALSAKAEAHLNQLMLQGRQRWQQLAELGARFAAVEAELEQLQATARSSPPRATPGNGAHSPMSNLEAEWSAFEADQELQQLRRQQQR